MYSVFKKEGVKVEGYYTAKKWILGAVKGFFGTTSMGHLINCIILPKNLTLNLKEKPLKICGKMAKNTIFNPKIAIFFIRRCYLESKGDKNEIQLFPGDF